MDQLFVIKIGGNIIDDNEKLTAFLTDFANIPVSEGGRKVKKILVHGGGKIATQIGNQLGIRSNYIDGRRITDAATIDLVTMVYGGLVNKKIVARLQALQCNAMGVTGADANIIRAKKRPPVKMNHTDELVDFGFVGDIENVADETNHLNLFLQNDITPVVSPLTHDGNGQMLNTNADTVAAFLATSLSHLYDVRLIYCFEKKGVLENISDEDSVISLITREKYKHLIAEGKLFDGILPKINSAFTAIAHGVKEVLIGHADDLLQNLSSHTKGTLIKEC